MDRAVWKQRVHEYRWPLGAGLFLLLLTFVTPAEAKGPFTHEEILDAIRLVESGGRDDCPDGDGGKAIGPFQIHEIYWKDAVHAAPELGPGEGHSYQGCRNRAYAALVIAAYMQRWVPDAWRTRDAEVLAKTHNGGPRGADKRATVPYWRKVEAALRAR